MEFLLLKPGEVDGLVSMKDAIDAVEMGYAGGQTEATGRPGIHTTDTDTTTTTGTRTTARMATKTAVARSSADAATSACSKPASPPAVSRVSFNRAPTPAVEAAWAAGALAVVGAARRAAPASRAEKRALPVRRCPGEKEQMCR